MASKRVQNFSPDNYYQLPLRTDVLGALRRICQINALIIFAIASLVLVGWIYDNHLLKSITADLPSMKANTAIAFLLSAISLLLTQWNLSNGFIWFFQKISAATVIIIGALTVSQYLTGINVGLDELFFKEPLGELGTASPNRMAPNSAILFILCGLALLFVDKKASRVWTSQGITIIATFILLPTIIGYVYGIEFIYGLATTTKMAIHTAVAFTLLISGIFVSRPLHGFISLLPRDDAGGFLARRLALTGILIPFALGWIILQGYTAHLYDANFRFLLLIGTCVIVFTFLIWRNALSLSVIDEKRKKAEGFLSHMAAIVQTSDDAIISRSVDGKILSWNRGAEKMYGYSEEEMTKSTVDILIPKNKKK